MKLLIVFGCLLSLYFADIYAKDFVQRYGLLEYILYDEFVHFCTSCLSWILIDNWINESIKKGVLSLEGFPFNLHTYNYTLLETLLCGCASCMVDFDRFIMAGTVDLRKALLIPNRGFAHSLLLPLFIFLGIVFTIKSFCWLKYTFTSVTRRRLYLCTRVSACVFCSILLHQIRDAKRRGFYVVNCSFVNHNVYCFSLSVFALRDYFNGWLVELVSFSLGVFTVMISVTLLGWIISSVFPLTGSSKALSV